RALAVSPDGAWCATAGEDRRIGLWEATSGRHLAWLQASGERQGTAHQGAVTWVQFTPDRHLVSAGRDNVLQVWKLDGHGATLVATHAGRTGELAQLGVSSDGRRVLFDHGE